MSGASVVNPGLHPQLFLEKEGPVMVRSVVVVLALLCTVVLWQSEVHALPFSISGSIWGERLPGGGYSITHSPGVRVNDLGGGFVEGFIDVAANYRVRGVSGSSIPAVFTYPSVDHTFFSPRYEFHFQASTPQFGLASASFGVDRDSFGVRQGDFVQYTFGGGIPPNFGPGFPGFPAPEQFFAPNFDPQNYSPQELHGVIPFFLPVSSGLTTIRAQLQLSAVDFCGFAGVPLGAGEPSCVGTQFGMADVSVAFTLTPLLPPGASFSVSPVPEPSTLLLVGTTAAGLGLARWAKRRRGPERIRRMTSEPSPPDAGPRP